MAKQVYDLQAGNCFSRGQSTEHLRNYRIIDPAAKKYGYYDPTRMHLNFEVTTGLLDKLGICIDEKALSDLEGEKVFLNFM